MTLPADRPNLEALEYALPRTILPNTLSAAELAQLPAEIRQAAVFSAGVTQAEVTQAEVLQLIHERVAQMTGGLRAPGSYIPNIPSIRTELKELLAATGYRPAA